MEKDKQELREEQKNKFLNDFILIKNALQINIKSTKELFEHFSTFQEIFRNMKNIIGTVHEENKQLKEENKRLQERVQMLTETCEMFSEQLAIIQTKLNKLENPLSRTH